MTIDERLDALTMNVELLALSGAKSDVRLEKLKENMDALTLAVAATTQNVLNLAEFVRLHESRIFRLEQAG